MGSTKLRNLRCSVLTEWTGSRSVVLRIHGKLDGGGATVMIEAVRRAIRLSATSVTLDLRATTALDPTAAAALLRCYRMLGDVGGQLVVAQPSQPARQALRLAGLLGLIDEPLFL